MKPLLLFVLLSLPLTNCHQSELDQRATFLKDGQPGEVAAVLVKLNISALADCACCAAYQLQVGKDTYETDQLPVSFDLLTPTVWIQYNSQQLNGTCSQVQNRIRITSIRNR